MGLGVGGGLGLVSDDDVAEGEHLVDLGLEELGDERGRQVHGERLSRVGSGLGELEGGLDTVGEEEASEVEELGLLDQRLDLGGGEVRGGEGLGSSEGGGERSETYRNEAESERGELKLANTTRWSRSEVVGRMLTGRVQ